MPITLPNVCFSNRPFEVKHFQTIHHCTGQIEVSDLTGAYLRTAQNLVYPKAHAKSVSVALVFLRASSDPRFCCGPKKAPPGHFYFWRVANCPGGSRILHCTPRPGTLARPGCRAHAARLRSMTMLPNPRCAGFTTAGPQLSTQSSSTPLPSASGSKRHAIDTRPSGTDRAPYLAALVASSCKAKPRFLRRVRLEQHGWAFDENLRFAAVEVGPSCRPTKSASEALFHSSLNRMSCDVASACRRAV